MTEDIAAVFRSERPEWHPPFVLPEGVEVRRDLTCGTGGGRELRADLFMPPAGLAGPRPAMLYIHGGGWQAGSRSQFYRQAALLAAKGVAGACCEYRLSGEATYPAAVHDVKCAVRWLRASALDLSLDPGRIGCAGGSAGGHLAAMLATTAGMAQLEGEGGHTDQPSDVQLAVLFNAALDLHLFQAGTHASEVRNAFLGGTAERLPKVYDEASPVTHVGPDTPPCLLLHGDADDTVPCEHSVRFRDAMVDAGAEAELVLVEGAAHGFFNSTPHFEDTYARMERFVLEHLGDA